MTIVATSGKIHVVEYLRGIAALGVAWFHLTNSYGYDLVRASGSYGWLGVDVFFVISGFVLPFSLISQCGDDYGPPDFGNFMLRRLVRIEPPYLISVILVSILAYLTTLVPGFAGASPNISMGQILSHIAYLPTLMGYDWLQPVYWTLAFEFCFYLIIGLSFRFVLNQSVTALIVMPLAVLGFYLLAFGTFEPRILLFPLGGCVLLFQLDKIDASFFWPYVAALFAAMFFSAPDTALAGLTTAGIILFARSWQASKTLHLILIWLGGISYSLYIVHIPIGGKAVNLGRRFVPEGVLPEAVLSLAALFLALAVAFIFNRLFERPFVRLSKRLKHQPLGALVPGAKPAN